MAQRCEGFEIVVALPDPDLVPVAEVRGAAQEVAAGGLAGGRERHGDVDGDQRHHHEQGGQQAAEAAEPELAQVDAAGALVLADQQQRDQVAGDDEEHFDTQEATRQPVVVGVVEHHRDHGDGAQAVEPREVRHAAEAAGLGSGGCSRHRANSMGREPALGNAPPQAGLTRSGRPMASKIRLA
jgi:hypothetical protein